ncbi:RNA methyltransferase [uncultured Prochlorococcus sp.]|uniref:RNA methyltransferase n=1 Tax=uncultured Prochlorococcus sp. TaxID=159733 RepID=UPI00258C11A6|nr:RNA methyltransferase [uncultured Prochlorococcus sp.]
MILGKNFSNLKVILVEPNGPLNVGSVARLCSNFEVDELRIVSPKCDIFSLEAKKMALKGHKFLENCKIFDDLQKAIFDCDLVLASCGRIDENKNSFFGSSEDIVDWTLSFKWINNLAIIFGREDRGLTNSELLLANKTFTIPTSQNNPSLNLSHAVSIALYELNKSSKRNFERELKVFNLASSKQIHDSFSEIEELLLKVGYLLKHTSKAKISKFKNFILRANTSIHEINVLRGIVHQINWFLNNSKKN